MVKFDAIFIPPHGTTDLVISRATHLDVTHSGLIKTYDCVHRRRHAWKYLFTEVLCSYIQHILYDMFARCVQCVSGQWLCVNISSGLASEWINNPVAMIRKLRNISEAGKLAVDFALLHLYFMSDSQLFIITIRVVLMWVLSEAHLQRSRPLCMLQHHLWVNEGAVGPPMLLQPILLLLPSTLQHRPLSFLSWDGEYGDMLLAAASLLCEICMHLSMRRQRDFSWTRWRNKLAVGWRGHRTLFESLLGLTRSSGGVFGKKVGGSVCVSHAWL